MISPATVNQKTQAKVRVIRVAILADEPLGWESAKQFFPLILDNYSWKTEETTYSCTTRYISDEDIRKGRLTTADYDVLLVPGGGVGDGHAVMKGFTFLRNVRTWKQQIKAFIQSGGGYVGVCGGAALMTDLHTQDKGHHSFLERQYHKSSLGVSCVSSYYRTLAFPLFYLFQHHHPEYIGATAYVLSFAPGTTTEGAQIHAGGAPVEFHLKNTHPLFSGVTQDTQRIRWWGGPALLVPEHPDREVHILATYPAQDPSANPLTRLYAWRYTGGIHGLLIAFFKAFRFIKKEHLMLRKVFLYTYFFAGKWELTDKIIELDYSKKPAITAEIYPNEHQARILLCSPHPEYMVWWNGHIVQKTNSGCPSLSTGLYRWEDITPLSKNAFKEVTHTWWMVRRFVAWAAKIPDSDFPPLETPKLSEKEFARISQNVFWDGSLLNQMKNI